MISYQSSRGLSADGVVGTSTWYSMWNDVAANAYMGVCDGSYHCYGPAFGNRSYQAFKRYSGWMFGQDAPWFTRRTGGTGAAWVTFDVGGPA
ncbi:MAG: hypothetical protein M5U14_14620 [Acidimicrobiia bacterium]|nr:hypothetical protein [Acidimicrobiia bacterium]